MRIVVVLEQLHGLAEDVRYVVLRRVMENASGRIEAAKAEYAVRASG